MKKEEQETYQPYEEPGWSAKPLGQWKTVETYAHTSVTLSQHGGL